MLVFDAAMGRAWRASAGAAAGLGVLLLVVQLAGTRRLELLDAIPPPGESERFAPTVPDPNSLYTSATQASNAAWQRKYPGYQDALYRPYIGRAETNNRYAPSAYGSNDFHPTPAQVVPAPRPGRQDLATPRAASCLPHGRWQAAYLYGQKVAQSNTGALLRWRNYVTQPPNDLTPEEENDRVRPAPTVATRAGRWLVGRQAP